MSAKLFCVQSILCNSSRKIKNVLYTVLIYFSRRWTKDKLYESWQQDSQTHVEYLICGTLLSIMNLRSNNWRLIVWPCLSVQQAKEWHKVGRRVQITWLHLTIGPAGGGWGYSDCQFDIVPTFPLFSYFERQCVLTYYNYILYFWQDIQFQIK